MEYRQGLLCESELGHVLPMVFQFKLHTNLGTLFSVMHFYLQMTKYFNQQMENDETPERQAHCVLKVQKIRFYYKLWH